MWRLVGQGWSPRSSNTAALPGFLNGLQMPKESGGSFCRVAGVGVEVAGSGDGEVPNQPA